MWLSNGVLNLFSSAKALCCPPSESPPATLGHWSRVGPYPHPTEPLGELQASLLMHCPAFRFGLQHLSPEDQVRTPIVPLCSAMPVLRTAGPPRARCCVRAGGLVGVKRDRPPPSETLVPGREFSSSKRKGGKCLLFAQGTDWGPGEAASNVPFFPSSSR